MWPGRLLCRISAQETLMFHSDQQTYKSYFCIRHSRINALLPIKTISHALNIIVHDLNILTYETKQAPTAICNYQLHSIDELRELFNQWRYPEEAVMNPELLLTPCKDPNPRVNIAKRFRAQDLLT